MARRGARVLRVGLVLVGALLGGAALYAFGLRHPVGPAAPHARVVPSLAGLPRVAVCWVESGRLLDSTASGLLVRHPSGDVLVDGGNSTHFTEEIAPYPLGDRLWYQAVPGAVRPSRPLPELLREVGEDPARLRWFLPTHAHLDHVGGLVDLPTATPVLLDPREIEWVSRPAEPRGIGVIPAHAARLRGHLEPIAFAPTPYERFDESADLFGDGSVVVVPLHGHTPGSVGVFVNLGPTRRIFHLGDAAHDWRGLEKGLGDPPMLAGTNVDPALTKATLATLTALHREAPELMMIPAHARGAWARVFPAGPGTCVEH